MNNADLIAFYLISFLFAMAFLAMVINNFAEDNDET